MFPFKRDGILVWELERPAGVDPEIILLAFNALSFAGLAMGTLAVSVSMLSDYCGDPQALVLDQIRAMIGRMSVDARRQAMAHLN